MANKHKNLCPTSLVTREMQNKTAMICHFTPAGVAKVKKTDNNKYWQGYKETGTLTLLVRM